MSLQPITATAPGKMLLLGEYAVLEGCPALAVAVDRRAAVHVEQTEAHEHTLESSLSPGSELRFSVRHDEMTWSEKTLARQLGLDELLGAWLDVLGDINAPALHIRMDTSAFFQGSGATLMKMGLGSSAALRIACAGVFCRLRGEEPRLPTLIAAHRDSQGGSGSGVDIATALSGGAIRFQTMAVTGDPDVQKCTLPASFHYAAIWTGASASTGELLTQFRRWARRNGDQWQMCMLAARVISNAAFRAIDAGDSAALVRTIKGYGEWMKALEKASKIRIYTPAHSFLDTMSAGCGCAYKPSGAGGGDIGVAVAASSKELTDFQDAATAAGYHWLAFATDEVGLEVNG